MDSGDNSAGLARPLLFVSYSRGDLERARPVIDLLEASGFDVWWDGRLEGGENYLQTTETALETAACVVVLWSATSTGSHWVRDEAQRGRERGCLVPLTIDGTMAPLGFRQFQLLDISGWDGKPGSAEAARILVAVRAKVGGGQPAPASVQTPSSPGQTPGPARSSTLSRRTMLAGGVGVAAAAGGLGAWQFGLFGSPANATTSMVVLPFANQTGDPDKKYFSDGLARELRTILSRNPRLKVAAPTSSSVEGEDEFALGRKLGVAHVLRGSVQRDTTRVRVGADLVAVKDGEIIWSDTYDRTLDDVFAVQSEIAQTVALSLVAKVAGASEAERAAEAQKQIGGTQNVAAYEAFLRGHALYDLSAGSESDRIALAQFDAAIAADADFAAAYAMRSTMLAAIANAADDAGAARQLYVQSISAAERAIAIEPKLARGHTALGFALNNGQLKRAEAAVHYRAAEQLAVGDADVLRSVAMFQSYGNSSEQAHAREMIDRVLELDPLNARAFLAAGYIALFARDYPLVISRMGSALKINPSMTSANFGIANARLMMGDAAGAKAAAEKEPVPVFALTAKAIAADRLGDAAGADAAFAALIAQYGDACLYQQAQVLAQRRAPDEALARLEQAYVARDPGMLFAPNDPLLDPLRGEPAFRDLLSRLGS